MKILLLAKLNAQERVDEKTGKKARKADSTTEKKYNFG